MGNNDGIFDMIQTLGNTAEVEDATSEQILQLSPIFWISSREKHSFQIYLIGI